MEVELSEEELGSRVKLMGVLFMMQCVEAPLNLENVMWKWSCVSGCLV